MKAKRIKTFCIATLIAGAPIWGAANAGLLDFFQTDIVINCPPRDAMCLFETALEIDLKGYENRQVKRNYAHFAKRTAQLMLISPSMTEADFRARWTEAGADENFFSYFETQKHRFEMPKPAPLDYLAKIIQNKTTPDGEKLSTYLKRQMPIAFEQQGQSARDFWLENIRPIWSNGWSSILPALRWLAVNDYPTFRAYVDQYRLPEGGVDNPYELLSLDAADLCASGNKVQGENILADLEYKVSNWKDERDKKAMDRAALTPAILQCRGDYVANLHVGRVLSQMQIDIETAVQKHSDEKERNFVLGVISSEVAERMIQPLVIWLHEQGREDDGRAMFAQLPVREFSMTIGDAASGDLLAAEFPEQDYERLIKFHNDTKFIVSSTDAALKQIIQMSDREFRQNIFAQDQLMTILKHIENAWPSDLAREAALKAHALYKNIINDKPDDIDDLHQFELELAALERTVGCKVSDARLTAYQKAMPDYQFNEQKVEVLIAYIAYLQAPDGDDTQNDCIIQ